MPYWLASANLHDFKNGLAQPILFFMGIKLWRAPVIELALMAFLKNKKRNLYVFSLHAYAVTALNPKGIIFLSLFTAIPGSDTASFAANGYFEITFLVVATINVSSYALLANLARQTIRKPSVQRTINRVGGSLFYCIGLISIGWRRQIQEFPFM